jgi:gliding motility-associated-like protein
LSLTVAVRAGATHIYGADFYYEHVSGKVYQVTLVVYGDCSGGAFPTLATATPTVLLRENGQAVGTFQLDTLPPAVEVTPVCPSQVGQTNCKVVNGPIPGVTRYIYTKRIELPYASTSWLFRFQGSMGLNALAGRSNSITNILVGTDGSVITLEALLNNKTATGGLDSNSSPKFTTIPTPFFCINVPQEYNQGAVDAEKDSLVYALAPGLQDPGFVTYNPGYSATAPLHVAPGTFSFSTSTGQLSFTPDAEQRSLVVNQVKEYRNGVLIGTASREMTFIVIKNCTGTPPYSIVDTSAAASTIGGHPEPNSFHVCEGTDAIRFNVVPLAPGADTIFATVNGLPAGARATIASNNTPRPVITLSWPTLQVPVGSYNFFVTYKDNDCPLSSVQTQAYTIHIVPRPVAGITGPEEICQGDTATFRFTGKIGPGPNIEYKWDWDHPGYTNGSGEGPWQVHWFSAGVKTVRMHVIENGCPSVEAQWQTRVRPAPYAGFSAPDRICQFDTLRLTHYRDFTKPLEQLQFAWDFDGADTPFASGPGPYVRRWMTPGLKHVTLSMLYEGCTGRRSLDIMVHPVPDARINNAPGPVCIGDKIFLTASGGEKYTWLPKDSVQFNPDGRMYAQILQPSVYRVMVTSEFGCVDSAAISYSVVEPCCNFAYPNAFTPNGDGRNDRFRIVTYGNHLEYELSIYNNWGQRVYYGLDAKEGWDGTFNGKPCDAGTYFYYLNAKCFTSHQERHKGSLMLVK